MDHMSSELPRGPVSEVRLDKGQLLGWIRRFWSWPICFLAQPRMRVGVVVFPFGFAV